MEQSQRGRKRVIYALFVQTLRSSPETRFPGGLVEPHNCYDDFYNLGAQFLKPVACTLKAMSTQQSQSSAPHCFQSLYTPIPESMTWTQSPHLPSLSPTCLLAPRRLSNSLGRPLSEACPAWVTFESHP